MIDWKAESSTETIIDISRDVFSYSFMSQRLWEKLFRLVDAGKFKRLQNFLVDLRIFEEYIKGGKHEFYWFYDMSGWTRVRDYYAEEYGDEKCFKIVVDPGASITITIEKLC